MPCCIWKWFYLGQRFAKMVETPNLFLPHALLRRSTFVSEAGRCSGRAFTNRWGDDKQLQLFSFKNYHYYMNKFSIIALMVLLPALGFAQQSWDVTFAKKTLLKKAAENPVKNTVTLSRSSLTTKNKFILKLNNADTAYNITIEATDENGSGQQNWEYTGKPLTLSGADIKKLLTGRSKIKFQYMAIPKDPKLAALVRIRPVHICTVAVK